MHVFLTGSKRVGKSTLLNRILSCFPGRAGGFRTVRLNGFLPGHFTVHLFSLDGSQIPTEENLLFICGKAGEGEAARFDVLGCAALGAAGAGLIVMDELGPHEAAAKEFQAAVRCALEKNVPILGVLQQTDSAFLREIAGHPNVCLIEVTLQNRDRLQAEAADILRILQAEAQ